MKTIHNKEWTVTDSFIFHYCMVYTSHSFEYKDNKHIWTWEDQKQILTKVFEDFCKGVEKKHDIQILTPVEE